MDNRKFDKIVLRLGLIFSILALFCVIITDKPSAEFAISIISLVCSVVITVVIAIKMNIKKDK